MLLTWYVTRSSDCAMGSWLFDGPLPLQSANSSASVSGSKLTCNRARTEDPGARRTHLATLMPFGRVGSCHLGERVRAERRQEAEVDDVT